MTAKIWEIPVCIIVWTQEGCPACEEYMPVFLSVAKRYQSCLPIFIADVNRFPHAADHHGVQNTPTTIVARYGKRSIRSIDGAGSRDAVESIFYAATVGRDCQV